MPLTSNLPRLALRWRIGDDVLEALCELGDGFLHPPHLLLRQVIEALLRQGGEPIALTLALVALLQLEPHRAADHVAQVLEPLLEEAAHGLGLLGRQIGAAQLILQCDRAPPPERRARCVCAVLWLKRPSWYERSMPCTFACSAAWRSRRSSCPVSFCSSARASSERSTSELLEDLGELVHQVLELRLAELHRLASAYRCCADGLPKAGEVEVEELVVHRHVDRALHHRRAQRDP